MLSNPFLMEAAGREEGDMNLSEIAIVIGMSVADKLLKELEND